MHDELYASGDVDDQARPIFDQLSEQFPNLELWTRRHDYSRFLYAGLVDRNTRCAATVAVANPQGTRTMPLSEDELSKIRAHFLQNGEKDINM